MPRSFLLDKPTWQNQHTQTQRNTIKACMRARELRSCLTLCDPMDCSPPGSSVHGVLQARTLEWVARPSSRGSSRPRDWTHISCISCTGSRGHYYWCQLGSPYYQRHVCNKKEQYLIEFWFTEHSIQAFRRHRKHSVISCRLEARCSTWDGSLQASSTAWEDFFKISRTLWKIVLGAVSLKNDKIVAHQLKKKD